MNRLRCGGTLFRDYTIVKPFARTAESKGAEEYCHCDFTNENAQVKKSYRTDKIGERLSAPEVLIDNMGITGSANH